MATLILAKLVHGSHNTPAGTWLRIDTDSQGNESSYNDLLLPANDEVAGSVKFVRHIFQVTE